MSSVSIIIPTYNIERFIRQTIDAILAQSCKDIEIIVVDDGSTDGTRDLVRAYGAPVRLVEQKNAGVCAARNHGLREARSPFICFIDHDDYWYPDKLESQLAEMNRDPELGVVYTNFEFWRQDAQGQYPEPASFSRPQPATQTDPEFSGWIYPQLLLDCWVLTSTAMFRAEVLREVGAFDESLPYSEDWDLWLRISRRYRFTKLSRPSTLYRQLPTQGSRVLRPIDYRTRLLERAVAQWGLAGPDGKALSRSRFAAQLASYHQSYGFDRLKGGQRLLACQSFLKAFAVAPTRPKSLAYLAASLVGWRPRW
jgi:hypothetical protein